MRGLDVLTSSAKQDWSTPRPLFDALHREFQFTIDVCAHADNACLPRYWTEQDNCLIQSWAGERCYMNPPFGQEIPRFVHKAFDEAYSDAEIVVALLPARVDTAWWHKYVMRAAEVRFIKGRVTYGKGEAGHNAPFPSAVVVFDRGQTGTRFRSQDRVQKDAPLLHPTAAADRTEGV